MFKLLVAIVAFQAATCIIGGLGDAHGAEMNEFESLNQWFINATDSDSFQDNISKLRAQFKKVGSFGGTLALEMLQLNEKEVCQANNIEALDSIIDLVLVLNKDAFKETTKDSRLSRMLSNYVDQVSACLKPLEHSWIERGLNEIYKHRHEYNLAPFDALNSHNNDTTSNVFAWFDDILERRRRSNVEDRPFLQRNEVLAIVRQNEPILKSSTKWKSKWGRVKKRDAVDIVNDRLIIPCELLVRATETLISLQPIAELRILSRIDGFKSKFDTKPDGQMMKWATRYVICDSVMVMSRSKLVNWVNYGVDIRDPMHLAIIDE